MPLPRRPMPRAPGLPPARAILPLLAGTCAAIVGPALGQPQGPLDALPPVPFPAENPFSEAKRILGKVLFWDEQLSSDNTVSCATCHLPEFAGGDPRRVRHPGVDRVFQTPDDAFGSPGVVNSTAADDYARDALFALNPRITSRSAQSAINAGYAPELFWDGRARGRFVDPQSGRTLVAAGGALESQAVGPPVSDTEMAHAARDWSQITAKLRDAVPLALATDLTPDLRAALAAAPDYPSLFEAAFGSRAVTAGGIALAIATYERTLVADRTPWDAFIAGVPNAMTPAQVRGWQAFQAANCVACHTPPLFSDNTFRNIGLRPPGDDPGRQGVTGNPLDARRFKVPSLRNAGLKSSFMHTGQFTGLQQVIGFYVNRQAQFPQNRDPLMQTVVVPPNAGPDIQAFMAGGLLDPRVAAGQPPFDHPTLYSRRPNVNAVIIGQGTPGGGGIVPRWVFLTPPNVGNAGYKLGVQDGFGGAAARVNVSASAPLNNVVRPDAVLGPVTLAGTGNGAGVGTAHWPIPADPDLEGRVVFVQWVVDDPAAPGGQARTPPLVVTFFCGQTGCPTFCAADCDTSTGRGTLDAFDFLCFQNLFAAADPRACGCDTATGPGVCDVFDFLCFQNAFGQGCP